MPTELNPVKAVVPIVKATRDPLAIDLLGTGFFIGTTEKSHVVTAKHVFEDNPLREGEEYGVAFSEEPERGIWAIPKILGSPTFDVAVFDGSGFTESVLLQMGQTDPTFNEDVITYEYSPTRKEMRPNGTMVLSFEAYAHKGNVMQYQESKYPNSFGTPCFLTSFPALRGASGAPLLKNKNYAVVGMMVGNVERHLLPAHVETIQNGDDYIEKTEYFLPMGMALARSVIEQSLREMGIPYSYVE